MAEEKEWTFAVGDVLIFKDDGNLLVAQIKRLYEGYVDLECGIFTNTYMREYLLGAGEAQKVDVIDMITLINKTAKKAE